MQASIFAPAHASPAKLAQIELYGAQVHKIPGARQNASQAVMDAVQNGMVYASHANNPIYLLGQQTVAWEVWEQMAFHVPDWIVVPVGQGGNLLGYYEGFRALLLNGLIKRLPGIIAVQPQRLAPICDAYEQKWMEWFPVSAPQPGSVAEGLAITQPVRWQHILAALEQSHGFCVRVPEEQILPAQRQLAKQGFYVEPTSAVVIAALPQIFNTVKKEQTVVVSLTGSGLKSPAAFY
jgi:threonine synthase